MLPAWFNIADCMRIIKMSHPRVLVLEDHPFQRAVAVSALNRLGYTDVLQASDGQEAIDLIIDAGKVDIALCDLDMAGMDGLAFIRLANEMALIRSVIICSSLPSELLITVDRMVGQQGLNLLGIIEKPMSAQLLEPLLRKYSNTNPHVSISCELESDVPTEEEVREGILSQEFRAYFQPKFHLQKGEVDGAEVLVRWQSPKHGLISPALFIPTLQRCGLVDEMFFSLFAQGLSLQRLLQSHGRPFKLAFNLDVRQLENPRFVERIKALLRTHGASPAGLIFELTETGLLEIPSIGMENMVRLRMLGFGLAIDDFGVGYSSLERLCQMPFNEIKLDAGFVQRMQEPRYNSVIQSALSLAKNLDMRVVAEGIETIEQLRCLIDLGCHWGQGYLFARPMSWAHMAGWWFEGDQSAWRRALEGSKP